MLTAAVVVATLAAKSSHLAGLTPLSSERIPITEIAWCIVHPEQRDLGTNPHDRSWVRMHVNDAVLDHRRAHPNDHAYPVGSVFLKEKFQSEDSGDPVLATIMRRLAQTGKVTDWEFSTIEFPSMRRAVATNPASCANCHAKMERNGFVSRLTEISVRKHLNLPTAD